MPKQINPFFYKTTFVKTDKGVAQNESLSDFGGKIWKNGDSLLIFAKTNGKTPLKTL